MRVIVYGGNGWIGKQFYQLLLNAILALRFVPFFSLAEAEAEAATGAWAALPPSSDE